MTIYRKYTQFCDPSHPDDVWTLIYCNHKHNRYVLMRNATDCKRGFTVRAATKGDLLAFNQLPYVREICEQDLRRDPVLLTQKDTSQRTATYLGYIRGWHCIHRENMDRPETLTWIDLREQFGIEVKYPIFAKNESDDCA